MSVKKQQCQTGREPDRGRIPTGKPRGVVTTDMEIDGIYSPFVEKGHIYGPKKEKIAVTILRDTEASQPILLKEKLPREVRKVAGKNNRQWNRREENRNFEFKRKCYNFSSYVVRIHYLY